MSELTNGGLRSVFSVNRQAVYRPGTSVFGILSGNVTSASRLSNTCNRQYSAAVHDHFTNPRNVGTLDKNDPSVGTSVVGKAACGDVIKLQIKVKDNIIEDVKFKTFGCGSAIASSSYASEMIKGMSTDEALKIKNSDIADSLALPPVKIHCSLLAEDAIKLAIKDYQQKNKAAPTVA